MNRRHMIDDHHGRTAWRANLLVTAVDEIFDTHRSPGRYGTANVRNFDRVPSSEKRR